MPEVRLGLDASNLRRGGGVTHLVELLRAAEPAIHGFSQITVWAGRETLRRVPDRPWLVKSHQPQLDGSLYHRSLWQRFQLSRIARKVNCDIVFVPGGVFTGDFRPIVTMSQNLLPFEWIELRRFGISLMAAKMVMLRLAQTRTFRRSDGLIFLTKYARDVVMRTIKSTTGGNRIIPHGIDDRFRLVRSAQFTQYESDRPIRVLYVSIIDVYKHQTEVVEAIAALRASGLSVELELVGPAYPPALKRLERRLSCLDPELTFVKYTGAVAYEDLPHRYSEADILVFASSCENLPIILLEGMRSGLPIACSNRGPMPEVLGDAGMYFDPEKPREIASALRFLIGSAECRSRLSAAALERSGAYSWARCADETFTYLAEVARGTGS